MNTNGSIVTDFARVFIQAPELAESALQEALKGKYEVSIKKVVPTRIDEREDHLYLWPMSTGEKGVAVK